LTLTTTPGWMRAPIERAGRQRVTIGSANRCKCRGEREYEDRHPKEGEHGPQDRERQRWFKRIRQAADRRDAGETPPAARPPLSAMSTLGIVLVVVGSALMVAEAHLPSHGVLATGAVRH
jgi:hypothetical protein